MRSGAKYRRLEAVNAVVRGQPFPKTGIDTDVGREIYMNLALIDADLAGTADTLLNNYEVTEDHEAVLKYEVLRGSRLQLCLGNPDGGGPTEIDLSDLPDVLEYARRLEDLRKVCFEIVFGTRH